MPYTLRCLQFPDNMNRVPGYEADAHPTDDPAQVKQYLADTSKQVWDLVFSYESGQFFHVNDQVAGDEGAVINAWYSPEGGGPGPSALTILPFADGQFLQAANFVQFSQPGGTGNSINTEQIQDQFVTATVLPELPEYAKVEFSSHSTSTSIVITTTSTHMVFDHFFVIYGTATTNENTMKVGKGVGCLALAVYKLQTTKGSKSVSTVQWPKIPWWEWQEIFIDAVEGIAAKGHTEIFEHLSTRVLAETDLDVLRKAVADIGKRVEQLEEIKSMIAGLAERKRK